MLVTCVLYQRFSKHPNLNNSFPLTRRKGRPNYLQLVPTKVFDARNRRAREWLVQRFVKDYKEEWVNHSLSRQQTLLHHHFYRFFLMACAIFCLLERGGAGASKKKKTQHSHARPGRRTNVLDRVSNQIRACIAS
jgi:hypothetical protein